MCWIDKFLMKLNKLHTNHKTIVNNKHEWFGERIDNLFHKYEEKIRELIES